MKYSGVKEAESHDASAPVRMLGERREQNSSRYRAILWVAGCIAAFLQSWAFRHSMNPDGISYLDIAWGWARGDWHSLVNAYWSPLYPFLLGLVFRLLKPFLYWESTVAHFVNFVIFIFSFMCFELFLNQLIRIQRRASRANDDREPLPEWMMWVVGDSFFVYSTLLFIHMERLQPDLCVAALVFLAAAILLRIREGNGRWVAHAGFGAILGFAYLAKAAMFPIALVFLACCMFSTRPLWRAIPQTALASLVFLFVAAPFMLAISESKGRITYGDVGRIAYAEFADGVQRTIHWQGGPDGAGTPVHPTRMLLATPPLFEFATPVRGTYPPWYDPSYWYEGVVPVFRLGNQLRTVRYTIEEYAGILPYMAGLFAGFLGLAFFARRHGFEWVELLEKWEICIPATAALGLYALVFVEARYVAPFFGLIWMCLFSALRFPKGQVERVWVSCLVVGTALTLGIGIMWLFGRSLFRASSPQPFVNWEVAQGLETMGVHPGGKVGSIGFALDGYWAHLAGVQIVAEIPLGGTPAFWASRPEIQAEVLADFARVGAIVVVTDQGLPLGSASGWHRIGRTDYFAYNLSAASARDEAGTR